MTEIDIERARESVKKAAETVEVNRGTIEKAQQQEAHIDRVVATSDIKTAHYRNVLKRAGVLTP